MSKARKFYKKYERHVLLGLVILLLATFSVTGAIQCQAERGRGPTEKWGGSFQAAPTERVEIDDAEVDQELMRYAKFQRAVRSASREYMPLVMGRSMPNSRKDLWAHLVVLGAAKKAGYRAGDHEVSSAVRDLVSAALMAPPTRMEYSDVNYKQFLKERYRGSEADFLDAARDVVIKDLFLKPLVDTSRYQVPYEQAYETWKSTRERVDLRYVVVPAVSFAERARMEETSRKAIAEQTRALRRLTSAASQLSRVSARLEAEKEGEGGSYPASLADLGSAAQPFKVRPDPWEQELHYALHDGKPVLKSAGPDKTLGTADDVTEDVRKHLDTRSNAYDLATRINTHRAATDAWPASLDALLEAPGEGRLPTLTKPIKDGWERPFHYDPSAEAPTLTSYGADGEAGGGDDLTVALDPEAVHVPLGEALSMYAAPEDEDAWERPLRIELARSQPPLWGVHSAGADGEHGTDDDLTSGNEAELMRYFAEVQAEFRLPARRRFEAVFVHLPLLSDDILRALWEAFPQHRPTDEEELYQYWRSYRGPEYFYRAEDPSDPQEGHGAELARRVAPDAPVNLVPDADIFPEVLEAPAEAPAEDGDEDAAPGDEPKDGDAPGDGDAPKDGDGEAEGSPDGADDPEAETRKTYEGDGWREIVIRERFMERVLNDLLQRARESHLAVEAARRDLEKHEAMVAAHAKALEAWEDLPEDQRGARPELPAGEEPTVPEEVTLAALLAGPFAMGVAPGGGPGGIQHWITPELMMRSEWEANENFGTELQYTLNRLKQDGEYNGIPAQFHRRLTKVLVRRLEFKPEEQQSYEDVADEVFERYLDRRQMDLAVQALVALQRDIVKAEGEVEGAEPGDLDAPEVAAARKQAIEAWAEAQGDPVYEIEDTGLFIGSRPPPPVDVDDDTPEAEARALARRNFVWRTGYESVRASVGAGVDTAPGTFGRSVLRDPVVEDAGDDLGEGEEAASSSRGTGSAYLVRVKERVHPTKEEFSPRRYTEWLRTEVYGPRDQRPRYDQRLGEFKGRYFQAVARYLDDIEWLQQAFDLQTNTEIDPDEGRPKRQRRPAPPPRP